MSTRFPFPSFPRGWFVVAYTPEIAPGQVKTVHYFDQDIVLFRTMSGVISAVDKTCPHLGAHVGGGRVEGERLRCPFHAWGFAAGGKCVDIPYAPKIPPKAALKAWHVREVNGLVVVWYCAKGEPPTWETPVIEEEGWTANRVIRWEIDSHPQEIGENTVDSAHLQPVHDVTNCRVISFDQHDHSMRVVLNMVATGAVIEMPDEVNDLELDVTMHGVGQIVSNTHVITSGMRTRQRIYTTPITLDTCAIFGVSNIRHMPDPGYTAEMEVIFYNAFCSDFPKDFPIWSNKAYMEKPLLAGGDGPIMKYRRWCRQFYDYPPAVEAPAPAAAPEPAAVGLGRITDWLRQLRSTVAKVAGNGATTKNGHQPRPAPRSTSVSTDFADGDPLSGDGDTIPGTAAAAVSTANNGGTHQFPSVDAYFGELASRFDPSAAGDMDAVYQWVLTGNSPRAHFAEIKDGRIKISPGNHSAPTVTIEMSTDDYLMMINGELNGARAFSTGRGKLRGPVRLAMKMKRLFPLERAS